MHPFHEHMDHKKQKSRVGHIVHGYAHGGAVHHSDEREDEALIRREVKHSALKHPELRGRISHKAEGGAVASRQDKSMRRAAGGRTKHKVKGHTSVNVIVAPQAGHQGMAGAPSMAGPPPGAAPSPPAMPPRPPMAAGAPPMPPGGPGIMPPGLGPRRNGGRATYAKGGRIKSGEAWEEGMRSGTHVQNNPSGKNELGNLHRGKPITYATGGPIEAPAKMGPKFSGGAGGGEARGEKRQRARRDYVRA